MGVRATGRAEEKGKTRLVRTGLAVADAGHERGGAGGRSDGRRGRSRRRGGLFQVGTPWDGEAFAILRSVPRYPGPHGAGLAASA